MSKESPETSSEHPLPYVKSHKPRHPSQAPKKIPPPSTKAIIKPSYTSTILGSPRFQQSRDRIYSRPSHEIDWRPNERVPNDSISRLSRIVRPYERVPNDSISRLSRIVRPYERTTYSSFLNHSSSGIVHHSSLNHGSSRIANPVSLNHGNSRTAYHASLNHGSSRIVYPSSFNHGSSRIAYPASLNPPIDWSHKWFSSKSFIKRKVMKSTAQLKESMRMRDMLHFILSYHVKLVSEFDDSMLEKYIIKVTRWIDALLIYDTRTPVSRHELTSFTYATYMPERWKLILGDAKCIPSSWDAKPAPRVKQMPSWAIKSAIRQASKCILRANVRLVAISGQESWEVGRALKNIPEIQSKFDAVLYISVSRHQGLVEINEWIQKQIDEFIQPDKGKTYSFLVIMDCVYTIAYQTLEPIINHDHVCVVLATPSDDIYGIILVDVGIRMEYHLLPLEVFCQLAEKHNSGNVLSAAHKDLALNFLEHCHGDLDAVELLATELSGDHSLGVWKAALHELKSRPSSHVENGVNEPMIRVLTFLWKRKDAITKLCIQQYASYSYQEKLTATSLVSCWLEAGLVQAEGEGEEIIGDLTKSCLLMQSRPDLSMGERVKDFLLNYVIPSLGLPLKATAIVEDAEIINLRNSEETELPDSPICPHLVLLSLQNNCDVMMIPPLFFEHMPVLLRLNLSGTSIKTLPASISSLVSLRRLYLRSCDLFLELPPEIGQLSELEVIDLEGTKVMYLPREIARLKKLRQLKLSFYAYGGSGQESKQRIPEGVLSNLESLQELWIGVNPDEDNDEWTADVEKILIQLPERYGRSTLVCILLHVPDTRLLEHLPDYQADYRAYNYKLIVGRCGQRMISRIPSGVEEKFKKQKRLLKYVNGEHIPTEIVDILGWSDAFILDRHWTVKSLSEFATGRIYLLKLCLLVECNELQTILDEDDERFGCIEHLYVYYMKSLKRLCSGPVRYPIYMLKFLSLCTCTVLDSAFTISLLNNLPNLEELVLEDCPKMESLVTVDCAWVNEPHILPKLKKMSLRQLPQLVSISNGLQIAPKLEKLVIFYCPKLESISEVLGENLKVIKGETEWWDSLPWQETDPLANIFVPLRMDGDLMAQFTEDA